MKQPRVFIAGLSLSAAALVGIANWEQYRQDAYLPTPHDVPTVGWGETSGVKMGDKTTPDRALVQLLVSGEKHADGVRKCIQVPMHQHEFDAAVLLAYNIGVSGFCGSTAARRFNAGDYTGACEAFLMWNKQAGKELRGLTRRREAERALCLGLK